MFDVRLNGHVVVKDLDIFDRVGHSTAHDEIVPFSIRRGKLSVQGEVSTFNGKLTVEFVKVSCVKFTYLRNLWIVFEKEVSVCLILLKQVGEVQHNAGIDHLKVYTSAISAMFG